MDLGEKFLDLAKPVPLTAEEILKLVEHEARLITHDEIARYRNIDELMGKHKAVIILYVTKILPDGSVYGHWCCLFKAGWRPDCLSYFDPYGEVPDFSMKYMTPQAIAEYGNVPILSRMLENDGRLVVYNTAPLQKHQNGNAICGRLCGLRLNFRNLDGSAFNAVMNSFNKKGLSSDDLATVMTSFIN